MEIEKMEILAIDVKNLDEAIEFFSDLLGITFVTWYEKRESGEIKGEKIVTEHADSSFEAIKTRAAIDRTGFLELLESDPPVQKEGPRNIHFKVPDIEKAKAEMKQKGVRLIADIKVGGLKEAIFSPDDLHGIRLCLVEYQAPTLVDAILEG